MCALCKGEPKRGEWDTDRHCAGDTLITHTYNIQPVVRRGTAPGRTTRPGGCGGRGRAGNGLGAWRRRRAGAPAALRPEKCRRFHDFSLKSCRSHSCPWQGIEGCVATHGFRLAERLVLLCGAALDGGRAFPPSTAIRYIPTYIHSLTLYVSVTSIQFATWAASTLQLAQWKLGAAGDSSQVPGPSSLPLTWALHPTDGTPGSPLPVGAPKPCTKLKTPWE